MVYGACFSLIHLKHSTQILRGFYYEVRRNALKIKSVRRTKRNKERSRNFDKGTRVVYNRVSKFRKGAKDEVFKEIVAMFFCMECGSK